MIPTTEIEKWRDYKFGMFIHYGLYSIPGEGEWVMYEKPVDKDEYATLKDSFTAEKFDAAHLADLAKRAGMKYMVLTARHHDGFCLYDSKASVGDFTVANTPAAPRDLIREYTDACRAAGLGVGIYYSPMDWRFEGFFFPKMYRNSALKMREQCHKQVRELMTNYGKIDVLWYDGGEDNWLCHGRNLHSGEPVPRVNGMRVPIVEEFWGEYELDAMVRELQPQIVIDNRLGMHRCGDYRTPERIVGGFDPVNPWESCDTLAESWGWKPGTAIRSTENVLHLLIDVITGGGNLLLNVGPRGDGSLEPEHEARLLEVGAWLEQYGRAVYGTRGGPLRNNKEIGGFTCKENSVFCFLKDPSHTTFRLPIPTGCNVQTVTCLTGEPVLSADSADGILTVQLPEENHAAICTLVEIVLDQPVCDAFQNFDPDSFDAFA